MNNQYPVPNIQCSIEKTLPAVNVKGKTNSLKVKGLTYPYLLHIETKSNANGFHSLLIQEVFRFINRPILLPHNSREYQKSKYLKISLSLFLLNIKE